MSSLEAGTAWRRRPWWRVALAVLLVVGWLPLAVAAGAFLGWSSETLGWLWGALAVLPGLVGAALLVRGRSRVWSAAAVGLALVVGTAGWYAAPPTHGRIQAKATLTWPAGWQEVDRAEYGNTWCFKGCPQVRYAFDVPGTYDAEDDAQVRVAFETAGWSVAERDGKLNFRDGRWRATVSPTAPTDRSPYEVLVWFEG